MRVVDVHSDAGEWTAVNPADIVRVTGWGGNFTVYLRTGDTVVFRDSNVQVKDFIALWNAALGDSK